MNATGVIAALAAEARTLGPSKPYSRGLRIAVDGTLVALSGMGDRAAGLAARNLIDAGASSLVSWGMAGGLDPRLRAGTICLPHAVVSGDGASFPTEHHRRELLGAAVAAHRPVVNGTLLGSPGPIDTVAGKASAFLRTGAAAVDMESLAIARMAAAHGLPFIVVRVIVDTAADAVPESVLSASDGGQVHLWRLVLEVLQSPVEIAALVRLARRYRVATRALIAVARTGALAPSAMAGASAARIA